MRGSRIRTWCDAHCSKIAWRAAPGLRCGRRNGDSFNKTLAVQHQRADEAVAIKLLQNKKVLDAQAARVLEEGKTRAAELRHGGIDVYRRPELLLVRVAGEQRSAQGGWRRHARLRELKAQGVL